MLEELHVRDVALVRDAWLEFAPGMTVLTGETGAGKTALVSALKLLMGERADSTSVRSGADEALVEGRFRVGEGERVVRRRVSSDGRSKCTLDGEMATVGALASEVGPLVDLHGQHDHQALLAPRTHVVALDRFGGSAVATARDRYTRARSDWQTADARANEVASQLDEASRRADYLRFVQRDIDSMAPTPGEDAALDERLVVLRNAGRLAEAAGTALDAVRGEGGVTDRLAHAAEALRRVAGVHGELDVIADEVGSVLVSAEEAARALSRYATGTEHDPSELDAAMTRSAILADLKKKYGPSLEDVLSTAADAGASLAALEDGGAALQQARGEAELALEALRAAAVDLTRLRAEIAPVFASRLGDSVTDLGMPGSRFEVVFEDLPIEQWSESGPQRVEFMYSPAPAQPARPIARIASGGEVSRVMLALKGALGGNDDVPVLVFDEIDSGIGGATALAVGRRLRELSRSHQVIVVTHLAQVAAYADRHMVVRKESADGDVITVVEPVEGSGRTDELARMLSGQVNDTSRRHAEELVAGALAGSV